MSKQISEEELDALIRDYAEKLAAACGTNVWNMERHIRNLLKVDTNE